jgi:hypothetical protein
MASLRPGELGAYTSRDIAPMAPIWVLPGWPIFDPGRCIRGEDARKVNGSARRRSLRVWPSDCVRGRGATALPGPAAQRFLSTGQSGGIVTGLQPPREDRGRGHRCRIPRFFFFAPLTWVIAPVHDANQALKQAAGVGRPPMVHGRSASHQILDDDKFDSSRLTLHVFSNLRRLP